MDAVADEHFGLAVVHAHGDRDDESATRKSEAFVDVGIEVEPGGNLIQLADRGAIEIRFELGPGVGHELFLDMSG